MKKDRRGAEELRGRGERQLISGLKGWEMNGKKLT